MLLENSIYVLNTLCNLFLVIGAAGVGQQILQDKHRDIRTSLDGTNHIFPYYITPEEIEQLIINVNHNQLFIGDLPSLCHLISLLCRSHTASWYRCQR